MKERYPGNNGSAHGEKKEIKPAINANGHNPAVTVIRFAAHLPHGLVIPGVLPKAD